MHSNTIRRDISLPKQNLKRRMIHTDVTPPYSPIKTPSPLFPMERDDMASITIINSNDQEMPQSPDDETVHFFHQKTVMELFKLGYFNVRCTPVTMPDPKIIQRDTKIPDPEPKTINENDIPWYDEFISANGKLIMQPQSSVKVTRLTVPTKKKIIDLPVQINKPSTFKSFRKIFGVLISTMFLPFALIYFSFSTVISFLFLPYFFFKYLTRRSVDDIV